MIPLTFADQGKVLKVARASGTPEVRKHLEDLGFIEGSEVQVISQRNGDVIVAVKGTRLAITSQMASKIMVQ